MRRVNFFVISFFFLLNISHAQNRSPLPGKRYELLSGIREADVETRAEHSQEGRFVPSMQGKRPSRFLTQNDDYIPRGSHILVIGREEGRNAVFLARKGHKVTKVSENTESVRRTQTLAREFGVRVNTVISSYSSFRSRANSFDAIVNLYHSQKRINGKMKKWLKPGGILVYEVFTYRQLDVEGKLKESQKKHLVRPGELLNMFPNMDVLKYEEPLHLKNFSARIIVKNGNKKDRSN